MNILHLCLNSIVSDGWTYQDNLLSKYHSKCGHSVTIITSKWIYNEKGKLVYDSVNLDYINQDGVRIIRLPIKGRDNFNKKIKRFKALYSTIDSINPDIIFIHSLNSLENDTIIKYKKKHNNAILYADNHADLTNSGTNWVSKYLLHCCFWRHFAKKLIPYVRKFYGVLPARVDFLTEIYDIPKEKCELLLMGADDDLIKLTQNIMLKKEIRNKFQIDENDFLIVTGGKIDLWKTETLNLMRAINEIGGKTKLLIFGSVDDRLKKEFNSLLSENVLCCGWAKAEESYKYFSVADLVVFPGRHSVYWEQVVAQGIPMIVKKHYGTNHIDIGGNVIFLDECSVESLIKNIRFILIRDNYKIFNDNAKSYRKNAFLYSEIAKRSIDYEE